MNTNRCFFLLLVPLAWGACVMAGVGWVLVRLQARMWLWLALMLSEFPSLERALARLAPVRIGRDGRLMEWIEEYRETDPQHRHVSHLHGLYPASQISPATPEFFAAARKSLEICGDGATGGGLAWKINFWARLRDGDNAYLLLGNLLRDKTLPNLFDTHPPFQL